MPALGTKTKPWLHHSVALRAGQNARLPQQEVQKDADSVWDEDREQRPENTIHSAAAGIPVDVTDHQNEAGHEGPHDDSQQHHHCLRRVNRVRGDIAEGCAGPLYENSGKNILDGSDYFGYT